MCGQDVARKKNNNKQHLKHIHTAHSPKKEKRKQVSDDRPTLHSQPSAFFVRKRKNEQKKIDHHVYCCA